VSHGTTPPALASAQYMCHVQACAECWSATAGKDLRAVVVAMPPWGLHAPRVLTAAAYASLGATVGLSSLPAEPLRAPRQRRMRLIACASIEGSDMYSSWQGQAAPAATRVPSFFLFLISCPGDLMVLNLRGL
jgi:hypothetical protein